MQKEVAAQEALKKSLGTLDAYLQSHTYLVGDNVTLADIITFCNLYYGFTKVRRHRRTRGVRHGQLRCKALQRPPGTWQLLTDALCRCLPRPVRRGVMCMTPVMCHVTTGGRVGLRSMPTSIAVAAARCHDSLAQVAACCTLHTSHRCLHAAGSQRCDGCCTGV
jgi:Glutathione S-transferase, C-terminal domain